MIPASRGCTICTMSASPFLQPTHRAASGTAFSWLVRNSAAKRVDHAHRLAALAYAAPCALLVPAAAAVFQTTVVPPQAGAKRWSLCDAINPAGAGRRLIGRTPRHWPAGRTFQLAPGGTSTV